MHLLVANGAVLEARASQIMQCRRHGTQCAIDGRAGFRKIGVAFHADEPNLRPGEHARIGGTVRLMARRTALQSHGSMFENEGASLIAMTLEAARLVGIHRLNGFRQEGSMRIVAVHAGHGALRQLMGIRFLKAGPDIGVAFGALRIDLGGLARDQAIGSVLVNRVASGTAHLVFGMTAINASHMGGLV